MKKLCIVLLALLMLTACGRQEAAQPPVAPPDPEPVTAEVPEEPAEPEPVPEEEPVEIPTQIVEPQEPSPEEIPEEIYPLEWEAVHVEGLIEDTVAYDLEQPVFAGTDGAETISGFYTDLVTQLESHTREQVYPAVMEQHTGANVYGKVSHMKWNDQWVEVLYLYRVEYLNDTPAEEFTRVDRFDLTTGEWIVTGE